VAAELPLKVNPRIVLSAEKGDVSGMNSGKPTPRKRDPVFTPAFASTPCKLEILSF
jgi:hypothetical protein